MPTKRFDSQRGVALMMALIAVFLLVIITVEIQFSIRTEQYITKNIEVDTSLDLACTAGLEVAMARLREDRQQTEIDSEYDNWSKLIVHQDLREDDVAGSEFMYLARHADEEVATRDPIQIYIDIFDEAAKFNIYLLLVENPEQLRRRKEQFANVVDLFRHDLRGDLSFNDGLELAEQLIPFLRRTVEQPIDNLPVAPTKGVGTITDISELLYTKLVTPEILYDQIDLENNRIIPGLIRYLTVWSDMQININTADAAGLSGLFTADNAGLADRIIRYRTDVESERERNTIEREDSAVSKKKRKTDQPEGPAGGAPFEQVNDLKDKVEGISQDIYNQISTFATVQSSVFSIYVTAKRGIMRRTRMWVIRRSDAGPRIMFVRPVNFPYFLDPKEVEESTQSAIEEYENRSNY